MGMANPLKLTCMSTSCPSWQDRTNVNDISLITDRVPCWPMVKVTGNPCGLVLPDHETPCVADAPWPTASVARIAGTIAHRRIRTERMTNTPLPDDSDAAPAGGATHP